MTTSLLTAVSENAFTDLALATALLQRTDDAEWRIVWQNSSAQALWGNYAVDDDFELKLSLMGCISRSGSSSFVCRLNKGIQPFRFIATPEKSQHLLLNFLLESTDHKIAHEPNAYDDVYQLAFEGANSGLFDWHILENFVSYSAKVYELCGLSHAELGNEVQNFFERVHAGDRSGLISAIDAHLEQQWPFDYTFRFQTTLGYYTWLQTSGHAVWDPVTHKATRLVGMLTNVSDRKQMEEQVFQRELLIQNIIDSLPISIYLKDENGCFRFYSKLTERNTGVSRSEAIGRTVYEILSSDLARKDSLTDQQAIVENRIIIGEEMVKAPGQDRWFMLGKGPLKVTRNGKEALWILGFSIDVTEKKIIEIELEQARDAAQKASSIKTDFLSVMSHEIRTPLNSVIGSAELLSTTAMDAEQKQLTDMIIRSGEHLLHLINDILDYNKLDSGKMVLESCPLDLKQQVETVFDMTAQAAKNQNIKFTVDYPAEIGRYFLGDPARIRQILLNFISNAIKFTHDGFVKCQLSKIKESTVSSDIAFIRFEIIDSGIGIPQDKMGLLFSEFSQVDVSTTRQYGGTGLGLSICKKLVESMNGRLGVKSTLGKGSLFWFEIPLTQTAEIEVNKTLIDDLPELNRSLNILVAEDNLPNQMLIKALLTKMGHQVVLAENGLKLLDKINAQQESSLPAFDLILMDMQMPEMDGLEAAAHVRALKNEVAVIPIIALTANVMAGDRERVINAGMDDYLTKPINVVALKRALKLWGNQTRSRAV